MVKKIAYQDVKKLAKKLGGKLLSKEYVNSRGKLNWACEHGHEFTATYQNIKAGRWCSVCAGKKYTIKHLKKVAKENGGKCLSDEYIGAVKKYKWQCNKGHIWMTSFAIISKGSWCPVCADGIRHYSVQKDWLHRKEKNYINQSNARLRRSIKNIEDKVFYHKEKYSNDLKKNEIDMKIKLTQEIYEELRELNLIKIRQYKEELKQIKQEAVEIKKKMRLVKS
jgi:hypothetical protein